MGTPLAAGDAVAYQGGMLNPSSAFRTLAVVMLVVPSAAAETLDTRTALVKLGFPVDTPSKVLLGRFVETVLPSASDRELNVGIAFLAKKTHTFLTRELLDTLMLQPPILGAITTGKLEGDDAPGLAKLYLTHQQLQAYPSAAPGPTLNLSQDEIARLAKAGTEALVVEAAVRDLLRARHRAYRAKGIAGIAPYARENGTRDVAADLTAINRAGRAQAVLPTAFYDFLEGYPNATPADLTEAFTWALVQAPGSETITLTHAFSGVFAGVPVVVQRQYYVNTGYNTEQAIAGLVPVTEGILVVYTNHTSTDQVARRAGKAKRGIGRKLMANELLELFRRVDAKR